MISTWRTSTWQKAKADNSAITTIQKGIKSDEVTKRPAFIEFDDGGGGGGGGE